MAFVVERYLPGLDRDALLQSLERLEDAARAMREEGLLVHYLGSTIVPEDEACFCQFDASSEAVVVEVNRRAGLRFDLIVAALPVAAPNR
jgi:Nickel responsive protein SCO4226-like